MLAPFLASLRSDFHFALRQLRKSPGFAVAAVLTLALGIGATTAVYSLVDGVLLRPLPQPHPEQLVAVHTQVQQPGAGPWDDDTSYPDYLDWVARNHTFSGLAAVDISSRLINLPNGADGAVLPTNFVTANYFDVLGVQPIVGRDFAADEDAPARRVAIIGYDYWQRVFGLDPKAMGSTIYVSDRAYVIVGVMPKGFIDPSGTDVPQVWASFSYHLDANPDGKDRKAGIASIVGRLKPGVTAEQARADLSAIQAALAQGYPEIRYRKGASVRSQLADITGDVRPALLMLMAAVGAVLLIACTNVAGLMLSRTMKRRGEMALRTALGASQWRVWRQLLIESTLLGLLGGACGAAVAYLLLHLALPLVPKDIPRIGEVAINGRVLGFTVAVSLVCAVMSSLFPAWKLASAQPIDAMREQSKGATSGRRAHGFQSGLVVTQTALGFALLLASGLLIRGFLNLRHADTGFDAEHLFAFDVPLTMTRYPYEKKIAFYNELLPKLAALPGVHRVSGGYPMPLFWGWYHEVPLEIDGQPTPAGQSLTIRVGQAEPGFFETLGVPLLRGRTFTAADNDAKAPYVTVVNRAFVKKYFPNENPIGRHIRADLSEDANDPNAIDAKVRTEREIVGVVGDTPTVFATDSPDPLAIFPYAQAPTFMRPRVVMRVSGEPMGYEKSAEAAVKSIDPLLFLISQGSVIAHIEDASGSQRFETVLVSAFAAMALCLTAMGLYATLAAMVAARTREIGLRMALGSDRGGVAMLVLGRAALLLVVGLMLGGAVTLFASRLLASSDWLRPMLFGVTWFEPGTYSAILAVLAVTSIAACLVPTWNAVRVDPMRVLRDE